MSEEQRTSQSALATLGGAALPASTSTARFTRWRWALNLLFGAVTFDESEEYLAFRYRFLIVLMVAGGLFTGVFVLGAMSGANPINGPHFLSMVVFTAGAFGLWLVLRNRPSWFRVVAWVYEALCLWEYTSALLFVPVDELRLLWFYVNAPGVFILLGQRAGWAVTVTTVLGLIVANPYLDAPYSPNAMATAVLALLYMGVFFHAYVDRSLSFFKRMRDYNRQLHALASHDALTGVLNARAYYATCDAQIRTSQRQGTPFAVLFIDLDHFKAVNDTYGHAAGDEVLRTVARTLGQGVRRSDMLGRIGGEEFSVFLPNTDLGGAVALGETLRLAVQACQPALEDGQRLTITASIGVAANPDGQATMQAIQHEADEAMYLAKKAGRNRVAVLGSL
jgi:diguanylate cyclase (GGDEF)-like protein